MNDKAAVKRHWHGPGTTGGQRKWCLKGSLPAHRPTQNILQVPCPRQGSSFTAGFEHPISTLPGNPFSRSREAKELPGELGEPELPRSC